MRNLTKIGIFFLKFLFCCYGAGDFHTYNWKFHFPYNSNMGLYLAVAIPLDLPNKSVFLAWNFEANYAVPSNDTEEVYPPIIERSDGRNTRGVATKKPTFKGIDRKLVYDTIENKLNSYGFSGRACLLRTICETTLHSMIETNGVLGDIFHIMFTPTSSKNNNLIPDYERAEKYGRKNKKCNVYHKNCSVSLLDMIGWIGPAL